ncbi:hypothetical protein CENSYa_2032 [Cenarchaeum symbiosum A]|uniref:Uncharacterized protein n=1 Tax=Cenarchaeum symbiosum (strain A) TaxID=414004 RepID=A0RZ68_CENSY|nr:hypothetical protein CENSYa_2032 [Cenarchaeum symbiosum A]
MLTPAQLRAQHHTFKSLLVFSSMMTRMIGAQDVIVLILHANGDKLRGRSMIQKLAYFWSLSISCIENASFKFRYDGPYSAEIRYALSRTLARELVDENTRAGPLYDQYHYQIVEEAGDFVKAVADRHQDEFKQIKHIIDTCKESSSFQYEELSHATIAHRVYNRMPKEVRTKSADVILKDALSLGWNVEREKIQNGIKLLEKLGLLP